LDTLLTAFSLRFPAGFVSYQRHSWDSPFGAFPSRKVSDVLPPGWTRLPFRLPVLPSPKRWVGPSRPRFPGFHPSESPLQPACF
jgi:hypothetical protein